MTTVLLVEDEKGLAQAIQEALVGHGLEVAHVADGLAALKLCEKRQPDLIILDWMAPAMDGLEALRSLRRIYTAPVLILTAHTGAADRAINLELGADEILVKPFSMQELVIRVQALLQRFQRLREIVLQDREKNSFPITSHGMILLPDHQVMVGDGEKIDLTSVEFNLLYLLLRNRGRVFSRSYLLDTVWEGESPEEERAVDQVVSRLRKKLGQRGDLVETVWGKGYRLRK